MVKRKFDNLYLCGRLGDGVGRTWRDYARGNGATIVLGSPVECEGADVVIDEAQPFRGAFSLAINLNDLHLSQNPIAALADTRACLRPDGLFLGAAPARGTLSELADSLLVAETRLSGGAALRMAPLPDVRQWGDALARAGFALPVIDEMRLTVRYATLGRLFEDLSMLGWRGVLAERTPAPKRLFAEAERVYREKYGADDGRFPATFVFAFLSGWAPDKSQQQPARRGSATVSLADALKEIEGPPQKRGA